ncbi:MAG: hypothetical protein HKN34_03320 [Gammaproteobacteria bacterium]|nr:hypothetical protein [Gammaproteobacteria bacterium]
MDNMITSIIAAIIFIAFTAGLAESIGETPFIFIVAIVIVMMGIDVYQSIREGYDDKNEQK